jgi:hypothetical protein
MMKLPKRSDYLPLGLLVLFNIVFRYPTVPHPRLSDTYWIMTLANSISSSGYMDWFVHPLSAFGLYPLSYPAAGPLVLSIVSQTLGINMEQAVLLTSTFYGVFGCLAIYILSKTITKNDFIAFIAALLYSMSPLFLSFTNFNGSSRALFLVVMLLFVWVLLHWNVDRINVKFTVLGIFIFMLLGLTHRMAIFVTIFLFAYLITIVWIKFGKRIKIGQNIPAITSSYKNTCIFLSLFCALLLTGILGMSPYNPSLESFKSGYFFQGLLFIPVNLGIEYAMGVGVLILLAPIGLISLLQERNKDFSQIYLLVIMLCFAPFLVDYNYIRLFIAPFIFLLIGYGVLKLFTLLKFRWKNIAGPLVVSVVIVSILLPFFVIVEDKSDIFERVGHYNYMTKATSGAAVFMEKNTKDCSFISNTGGREISTTSNTLGVGCCGPDILIHSFIDKDDMIFKSISIYDFARKKQLYTTQDWIYDGQYWTGKHKWMIMESEYDSSNAQKGLNFYNVEYLVINNRIPNKWGGTFHYEKLRDSKFLTSVYEERNKNKIYDNNQNSMWYIGNPKS